MSSLYLVDGSNFLFRAFFAMPPMHTKTGLPTGAVRGFANMMIRLIGQERPTHMAVLFDAGGQDKRAALYPAYKANRAETPPDLVPQFALCRKVVQALGIASIDAVDAEADDLIATLTARARAAGLPVVVVSSDKDLMQLVCDGKVALLDTMKGDDEGKRYNEAAVVEKFGVGPQQLGDLLALMGDTSDNVPGVPGVGPKTATQLLQHFGSLDRLLAQLETAGNLGSVELRGRDKITAALLAHQAQLRINRQLVALVDDLPLPQGMGTLDDVQRKMPTREPLIPLLAELEFQTLLKRITMPGGLPGLPDLSEQGATAGTAEKTLPAPVPDRAPPRERTDPGGPAQILTTEAELDAWLAQAAASLHAHGVAIAPLLCGPTEGHRQTLPRHATLAGVALWTPDAPPVYLPLAHRYLGAPAQLDWPSTKARLSPVFASTAVKKYLASAKDHVLVFAQAGLPLAGLLADPCLCSYLLDPARDHSLPALVPQHLPTSYPALPPREALLVQGRRHIAFDEVDIAGAASLAVAEAHATYALCGVLLGQLSKAARALHDDMELPLSLVLAQIEQHGILIDTAVLGRLSTQTEGQLHTLTQEITALAYPGIPAQDTPPLNLNSPKQLAELLFEKLGLSPVKKTRGKTGLSVDHAVLEALAHEHPIAHKIMDHRSLSKLKNTYIDQLPTLLDKRTGRIHTTYQQMVAATGRLSSTDPNLQNIPVRSGLGQEIRRAFIAPKGHLLIAADYSQIELRVLAHLCQDRLLVESFQRGEDVHVRTAMEMFGPESGKDPEKRRAAKMINYGIIYGLTDFGLASRLGIERTTARDYIREYFVRYSGVRTYLDKLVEMARAEGGARTLWGRFRPLPEINDRSFTVKSYAERMAKNTPIQGTAADILKRAMIDVQADLQRTHSPVRMLLTVHDELVFEAPEDLAETAAAEIKTRMEQAASLLVPLQVDVGIAQSWADC